MFRYKFRRIAEAWEEAFPGCLAVRHYSSDSDFDVVRDFSLLTEEFLGATLAPSPSRANASVSAEAMEVLQRYRLAFLPDRDQVNTPDSLRLVDLLKGSAAAVAQTRPALRPEIESIIRANHRDDAAFLAQRYGVDLQVEPASAAEPPRIEAGNLRVADVLRRVDRETVTERLLLITKMELSGDLTKRALPLRIVSRLSRMYTAGQLSPRQLRHLR